MPARPRWGACGRWPQSDAIIRTHAGCGPLQRPIRSWCFSKTQMSFAKTQMSFAKTHRCFAKRQRVFGKSPMCFGKRQRVFEEPQMCFGFSQRVFVRTHWGSGIPQRGFVKSHRAAVRVHRCSSPFRADLARHATLMARPACEAGEAPDALTSTLRSRAESGIRSGDPPTTPRRQTRRGPTLGCVPAGGRPMDGQTRGRGGRDRPARATGGRLGIVGGRVGAVGGRVRAEGGRRASPCGNGFSDSSWARS